MKIGIYVAHEDDAILAMAGHVVQFVQNGDDVYVVIVTDGRHSHKAVLQIEQNPTPDEVKDARSNEIKRAMALLGVDASRLYFLEKIDAEGRNWQNDPCLLEDLRQITGNEMPDRIYFHGSDAHVDHFAVHQVVTKLLAGLRYKPEAFNFLIWVKSLAREGIEYDTSKIPECDIPENAVVTALSPGQVAAKRLALYEIKSQVLNWPYINWQPQIKPILDSNFINYFLRGEEVTVRIQ
jgi:LmbE family N-acetylglucosaminyl deacetylase